MAEDSWNTDWHDSATAIEAAAAALEWADEAILRMHTLLHSAGSYPPITG